MAFNRVIHAEQPSEGSRLTSDMVGIGMLFAARRSSDPNIEDTLVAASVEGMEADDLRVLAILTTWLRVHHERVNADRLFRVLREHESDRVRAYWAGVGKWLGADRRFARFGNLYDGRRVDLLRTGTAFQVKRRGEDERFEGSALRVPGGVLRDRPKDVLGPAALAKKHRAYHYRVLIGPSYRADMWAVLTRDPEISAAELARRTYGSFATAWGVKRDWDVLHPG